MPKPPSRTAPEAPLADAELPPLDPEGPSWPLREVEVNGVTVTVRTTPSDDPDAEPALFVHGLGGSATNWTDFAALLRGRLAIDAIDLYGHGHSGPAPDNRYTPDAFADLVIAYLEQSGRGPVHLVGNSMGGAVTILVASRRPDLVRTLTLVSPAVSDNRIRIYPLKSDPVVALLILPVLGEFVVKQFNRRYAVEVRAKGTIKLCFARPERFPAARLAEAVTEATYRVNLPWAESAVLRSMRGLVRSQFFHGRAGWRAMRAIQAPTLVLWGDSDRLVAPDLAPYVAAAVPDARLRVFTDIGHTAMMEDPVSSARAMVALLDSVRDESRDPAV
ncbi:alpha/beta fold hydrolase [uncultured Jatrophihabitans sp.]|uniref:alpha/beta fold hydrolase n=1 Tax=uncultured Jatrophihabitans sp. TaxID=1610747 RepID=UPI0035CB4F92